MGRCAACIASFHEDCGRQVGQPCTCEDTWHEYSIGDPSDRVMGIILIIMAAITVGLVVYMLGG